MERIPVLVAVEGTLTGQRFPLVEGEEYTIGRSEECAITIADSDVSREHARVILRAGTVWVQDENSRNGVFVNDKRVVRRPEELRAGGRVRLGDGPHIFTLELDDRDDDESLVIPVSSPEEKSSVMMWVILALFVLAIGVALSVN